MRPSHLEGMSLGDLAEWLVRKYAPDVDFRVRLGPLKNAKMEWEKNGESLVLTWSVTQGMSTLLHELGHKRCKHDLTHQAPDDLLDEAEAWLWAEKRAHAHGIRFDYEGAEAWFETYARRRYKRGMVKIVWRYR